MNSDRDTLAGGLPHTEIPGSPIARISPGLFAASHVLHRLSVPRHPPDALASRLITASPSPAMPHHRRAQGQAPCRFSATAESGGLYEDTSLGQARRRLGLRRPRLAKLCFAERGQALPAPDLSASVTSQLSLHPSINAPPRSPAALSRNLLRTSPHHHAVLPVAPPGATAWLWPEPGFAGGGGERIRTDDLLLAKQALSQLSYTPAPGIRRQQAGIKTSDP